MVAIPGCWGCYRFEQGFKREAKALPPVPSILLFFDVLVVITQFADFLVG
jgi:hypothetical protein